MSLRERHSVSEPQSLFGFLGPDVADSPAHFAMGGGDSFATEPKQGRAIKKVRELGQVATPRLLATAMAAWVTSRGPTEILDPAMGLGNLLHACRTFATDAKLEGIDVDPEIVAQARATAPEDTRLRCGDYLRFDVAPKAGIIANPPYIKAARLNWAEDDWAWFEHRLGCRLDRLTNIYALFLLKIWQDLAPGGRAAVLVPGEFLNANYGEAIKRQLQFAIRPAAILVLDPALNAFDTALTTSAILLLEKSPRVGRPLLGYCVRDLAALTPAVSRIAADAEHAEFDGLELSDLSGLAAEDKWLNHIFGLSEKEPAFTHRVGDFFRCSRGIATGANDYFCLTPSEIAAHGLVTDDFLPCVCKASDVGGLVFDEATRDQLRAEDKRCWLLAPKAPDVAMERYLARGVRAGVSSKFLPSHRPIWYLPENRAAAHAWIAVFSRERLKCVLNATDVRHLTCFHGVYARSGRPEDAALLVLFLNSSFGRRAIRQAQRFYGDGLNKLEPKDVEAIPCPSLAVTEKPGSQPFRERLRRLEELPDAELSAAIDALASETFDLTPQAVA